MATYPSVRWIDIRGADRPSFSADGTRIVYQDLEGGGLHVVPSAGGEPTLLLAASPELRPSRPDWSWSPETIAFGGVGNGRGTIWLIESDGSGLRELPNQDGLTQATYPSWYQDGRWIVAVDYAGNAVLFRLAVDGSQPPLQLTPRDGFCAGRPSVAPGGELAPVATAGKEGACDQKHNQIWIARPPSPDPVQLDSMQGRSPNWSPDGRWILFESNRLTGGNYQIFVALAPGNDVPAMEPVPLTDPSIFAQHAEWSRQQDRIVFERGNGEALGVIEVPAPFR